MINAINAINSNSASNSPVLSSSSPLALYKQAQSTARTVSQLVYQSISMLTESDSSGISIQGLDNLKTLLENENLTDKSAYKLVNTMLSNFSALSSNGESITQSDFMSTIKFAVAQGFSQSGVLSGLIQEGSLNISSAVVSQYGTDNAQTLAIIEFLDGLSEDTVNKISSNLTSASAKSTIKSDSYYGNNQIQDYSTVTKQQVTSPVNIAV